MAMKVYCGLRLYEKSSTIAEEQYGRYVPMVFPAAYYQTDISNNRCLPCLIHLY